VVFSVSWCSPVIGRRVMRAVAPIRQFDLISRMSYRVAITQWICGIRPELNGLRIDPVLPASWTGFTATRRFRGADYQITVRRSDTLESGLAEGAGVRVNGRQIAGTLLPLAPPGESVTVEVVLPSA
jgi:cellobiose phosphorylase